MSVIFNTNYGEIEISDDVITAIAGEITTQCYGIAGMASKNQLKDGFTDILKKDNYSKGVIIRRVNDIVNLDLYVIVNYGVKITDIARNVQQEVSKTLKESLGLSTNEINVYIQSVKINE